MTHRQRSSQSKRSSTRWAGRDRLRHKRLKKRHALLESLENRQLLAGPDLIGVQPNQGSLLFESPVLNREPSTQLDALSVSPRELVFRFDDDTRIDPETLSGIRITRAGEDRVFESASATSDLGTDGRVLLEFRAAQAGTIGNGITVTFTTSSRPGGTPEVSVDGRDVTIDVSDNPLSATTAQQLITAVAADPEASELVEVIQVSGSSLGVIGTSVDEGTTLTLQGANAAQAVTDFGTAGDVRVRFVSQIAGPQGRGARILIEQRNFGGDANPVVVVTDQTVRVQLNSAAGNETTVAEFLNAINNNPDASSVVRVSLEQGEPDTVIGDNPTNYSPISLTGVSDEVVEPGFVGLGDSPREVVFRFDEPLPDDTYQIDILGSGPLALANVDGEPFQDGVGLSRKFEINLGPKVAAVVPEPVRRNANGTLNPQTGTIEVHFNDDDLDPATASDPQFYQLVFTRDTADNRDDAVVLPTSVDYNNITNIATLNFGRPLSRILDNTTPAPNDFLTGAARLRVGTNTPLPVAPTEINLPVGVEPGDTLFDNQGQAAGVDLNNFWTIDPDSRSSARLTSEIFNVEPFGLDLPGPDVPGTRDIRPEDPSRLLRTVPLDYLREGADVVDGISVIEYNFRPSWLGDDPNRTGITEDTTYFNIISEQQKQRVREVLQLFSEYLGISFVEVEGAPSSQAFISIAVGDLYGGDERATSGEGGLAVVTRDTNGDGIDDLAVMDFQDFDESVDDQFGGEFFRGAMFAVGQLLGYGYADDLPQPVSQSTDFIFSPGTDNEPAFPSVADIVHGQHLYRPDSTDIDLYRFELDSAGTISIETIAERLGVPSLLDTQLRLFRADATGAFEEIAANDNYFSNDSLIEMEVEAGQYAIGVSAQRNASYDPTIPGTGFGGRSEGEYELRIDFQPQAVTAITDTSGVRLDGDADGRPGGVFNFWFVPADPNNTLYVDKAAAGASGGQLGTIGNPYREIDQAIAAANPGDTIRVLGNGGLDGRVETPQDNLSYQIGFDNLGDPLQDGETLELPRGVRMIIDSGAILKLSRSRIGVGSVFPKIDKSDSALQVLGTPSIVKANGLPARDDNNRVIPGSVYFTSVNDDTVGTGNTARFTPEAQPGDWGGIHFRGDLDTADEQRRNREDEGSFLNHVQYADISFGGGEISLGGQPVVISPIDMAVTRPTIINSTITRSADAAISATPDTFAETRFTDTRFQAEGAFTPDISRVGPEIRGNTIVDNSINGLFIRVRTRTGGELQTIDTATRFDDTDITHVIAEDLIVEGTPGGPVRTSSAPSSLTVRLDPSPSGDVPAGEYVYRITNVNGSGLESAPSQPTVPVTLNSTGGVQLSQLPTVGSGSDFVARRLYRATVDPVSGLPGEFRLVAELNASSTSFVDRAASGTRRLTGEDTSLQARLDASLKIDAGTVLKIDGARIESRFGGNLIAEGDPGLPIVFTSIEDRRYGAGGTFDTNDLGSNGELNPGDWGGIYIGHGSTASIDRAVIAGAGGVTRIEGGFASFNPIELHQGGLRLANTRFEHNSGGRDEPAGDRVGRGENAAGTVFARASNPILVNNEFLGGEGPAITIDVNSFSSEEIADYGRSSGPVDRLEVVGNAGPLVQGNVLEDNSINGMQVRGGQLATSGVWDDVDIVHVVTDTIEVPNQHIFGGLRLQSDARGSLVVKFESQDETAGIVVGGNLISATDQLRDIPDRIGGSLQVLGHPDFPVVMTTLADDFSGAGFTLDGSPQLDTNNDGLLGAGSDLDSSGGRLPTGPEVNNGTTIDNDVDVNRPGFFEATIGAGNEIVFGQSGVTVEDVDAGQVLVDQNFVFQYSTHLLFGDNALTLSQTNITQQPALVADDVVESRGSFNGPNGTVNWVAQSSFEDGVARLNSSLSLSAATGNLGDIRVVSYLDEDVQGISDDILVTRGTPGEADFRAFTIDGPRRVGFSHGGFYTDDGVNQQNAVYAGWAADQFPQLLTAINAGNATFSIPGDIDLADLPAAPDPDFGTRYGPEDITTAFAWDVVGTSSEAEVTSFLELLARDPAEASQLFDIEAGLWDGITVREAANDRNVAAITEGEPVRTSVRDNNAIPGQSQFLGEIAPNEGAGDENRRLGFIVDGAITTRADADVYSFVAESGTEVWLDIDRTSNRLDSVVELIDANGRVLAASNDSLLAETNPAAIYTAGDVDVDAAQPLSTVAEQISSQRITVSGAITGGSSGELALSIDSAAGTAEIPLDVFLNDPAGSIEAALESQFRAELGEIEATLRRRVHAGSDFVIELRFDASDFVGNSVPSIAVDATGVNGVAVPAPTVETFLPGSQIQDTYSTNPKDAGMRIRLPGEAGTRNLYHVRVRSSNTRDPLDFATLVDPDRVREGLTVGSYQLQVRLSEVDETAGTQMNLADVRYATNGVQVIGQPLHSPLLGEDYETNAPNDVLADAQRLGYFGAGDDAAAEAGPLQSDRLAKSFSGELSQATDVDWYEFEINYENLTRDAAALYLSTVFDLDYADNFARSDMALYVFNASGQLVLVGGDSNIADDLPGSADTNDTEDLSRGSAGANDPYVGAAELSEGTYFVAVSNQQQVPLPLDQYFNPDSANPLLRLEPIDSVRRIAEDRIDGFGGGTASPPEVPVLFDNDSLVDFSFDDTLLYVNTGNSLLLVNPFTGQTYGTVGNFGDEVRDVAFRANGELFAYTGFGNRQPADDAWFYHRIDTGTGQIVQPPLSEGAGLETFHDIDPGDDDLVLDDDSDDGLEVEAITIRGFQGQEVGFFVGNRPVARNGLDYTTNVLFEFDDETGLATGPEFDLAEAAAGAGTSRREVGQIDTSPAISVSRQLGVGPASAIDPNGLLSPRFSDGDTFTLSNGVETVTFELDAGLTFTANTAVPVRDGDAVDIDGTVFEFNTGARIGIDAPAPQGDLAPGDTLTVTPAGGTTLTFEFVGSGLPQPGNVGVTLTDNAGNPRNPADLAAAVASLINQNVPDAGARAEGSDVVLPGRVETSLGVTGNGLSISGDAGLVNSGAVSVAVPQNASPETVIARLAEAIRGEGTGVASAGVTLTLPNSSAAAVVSGGGLSVSGSAGVNASNTGILLLPGDSAETLAQRIVDAIDRAASLPPAAAGALPNVSASIGGVDGHSVSIGGNGSIVGASGSFVAGGQGMNGRVTGVELLGGSLYAITNQGGLYQVTGGELNGTGNRTVGRYVETATALRGLNFTGLRAGPVSVEGGTLSNLLFATTASGDLYAFNTAGELQNIFAGGRSSVSTGIGGALGLDFSTVDYNLWHTTNQRGGDPGHGIDPLFNGTRGRTDGNTSLAFSYEDSAFANRYPSLVERPVALGAGGNVLNPRLDGTTVEDSFNVPGGAKGVVQSNTFSLEGYAGNDQPTLYFNYFLDNDGVDDNPNTTDVFGEDRDSLRVYVITDDGTQHLVASNSTARDDGFANDEFDDPPQVAPYDDNIDLDVQQLFDNTGSWRQARVALNDFAGQQNLSLRIEFATAGTTETGSPSIRAIAADRLVEGEQIVIGGETFEIDLAPSLAVPSGSELAELYTNPAAAAVVTVDGQQYVLDDGSRTIGGNQIAVDLLAGAAAGTTIGSLSAADIATALVDAVQTTPPPNQLTTGLDFSDPLDAPGVNDGTNDLIYEATPLPYSGGNVTLQGSGRIGTLDPLGNLIRPNDVDLLRLEVAPGTTISVDADLDFNPALSPAVRFFDAEGNAVQAVENPTADTVEYTSDEGGTVFIGISGRGNESYDPRQPGSASAGQTDLYTTQIDVDVPAAIRTDSGLIEFGGLQSVAATPSPLFRASGQEPIDGIPVHLSRFMSASEVAGELQRAVAERFTGGDRGAFPVDGARLRVPSLAVNDAGPLADQSERYGDQFGAGPIGGTRGNAFEGAYLDDFIIGFAERGEVATGSDVVSTEFITDARPQFPVPADPTSDLVTGAYQVEIRDASEYVNSLASRQFRTFDTNDRLSDSRAITARPADQLRDGQTFAIFDGRSTVTFEFDQEELAGGVTAGNVRVPFTLQYEDPTTGRPRPNTAAEVAANIIEAINRDEVQSVIDVPALPVSGVDSMTDPAINLFGNVAVINEDETLASVDRGLRRGDDNRDRDGQGVILIENSRFLFNDQYAVDISHDFTANVDGNDTTSVVRYPRNLVELNSENLKPGVVVRSNVFAYNATGGVQVTGIDPAADETGRDPVPFERIVNNTIVGGRVEAGAESPSESFQGILFEQGAVSFADAVAEYRPEAGGSPPTNEFRNSAQALGTPDAGGRGPEPTDGTTTVSLGLGGSITLQFTNNLLTGSGDARPDLAVFETGAVESVRVEVSRDGNAFFDVGIVGGLTNQLDIDAAGFGREDRFAFVRLTDLRQGDDNVGPLGADIDAVGALSTVPVEQFSPGGLGVNVVGNAAPTLLNNVIANTDQAVEVSAANAGAVLGGNTFYRNTADVPAGVNVGQFAQILTDAEAVFVSASDLVFAPAAGASIIDSSIDSLQDRPSLTTVKNPLGLPPSPILAPRFDVNGQLRVDDPNVETPSGLGERVFKDRGAADRGDLVGPRVVLLSPQAPGLGEDAGMVTVFGDSPDAFEIQLIDGLAPADSVPGTGIDDRSVSGDSIVLLQDGEPLVEGVDYRFGYNPSTNVIRLSPIAGVWEPNSTYVIRMVDASDAIIAAAEGTEYADGGMLNVIDATGETATFEYETGIVLTLGPGLVTGDNADGITLTVFDGNNEATFELDNDGVTDPNNVTVSVPASGDLEQLTQAVAAAINSAAGLSFTATVAESEIQLLGGTPLSTAASNSPLVGVEGSIGTSIGFGLRIPNDAAAPDGSIADGQTFVIRRGAVNAVTFEFDTNNSVETAGAVPVRIPANPTLDEIADEIVRGVGGTTLGLIPENAGFGRVFLGGDVNYSLDLTDSTLTQLGVAGDEPTLPIRVEIDQSASEAAQTIAATIDAAALPGIGTSVVQRRVFLEGSRGVSGTGAVDLVVIRDEVGNELQSNQANGRTELTIFVGRGFDYGDAPPPYTSLRADGGPRHEIEPGFSLGPTVTPDADAKLPNADTDDGITFLGPVQAGFTANVEINVTNTSNDPFFVDAWFDWDADGVFENDEVQQFSSATFGGGTAIVAINVPPDAVPGSAFARFRLSRESDLGPTGDATTGGEVEDLPLVVTNNPFQNPDLRWDVNDSGAVTPIDALQVINALARPFMGGTWDGFLDSPPLPQLPAFPDVDGNSRVTALDALQVINHLAREFGRGEGEGEGEGEAAPATQYAAVAPGVMASGPTLVGDALISEESRRGESESGPRGTSPRTGVREDQRV